MPPYIQQALRDLNHDVVLHRPPPVSGKPGTRVTQLVLESDEALAELALDLAVMAEQAVPPELSSWAVGTELPLMPKVPPRYADVVFLVEEHRFPAHKVTQAALRCYVCIYFVLTFMLCSW